MRSLSILDLPIQETPCRLEISVAVCYCPECDKYRTMRPPEVHPTAGATWRLMLLLTRLYQDCPVERLAKLFHIAPTTIRRLVHSLLTKCHELMPVNLNNRRKLIIDEKFLGSSTHFVTVVIDGETGEVLYLHPGRSMEAIAPFFEAMTDEQRSQVEIVSIDRSSAYKHAVEQYLPDADISFDLFHLICNINEAVDKVRRAQWHQADKQEKKFIKGSRYVLLRGEENLSDTARQTLDSLKAVNEPISTAYLLKEQFRDIFKQEQEVNSAQWRLINWVQMCAASHLVPFQKLAKSIAKSMNNILNFFRYRLTSGRIEGLNAKISRLSHKMRGIVNPHFLFLLLRQQTCPAFARCIGL